MTHGSDVGSVLKAAHEAAGAGDYESAERLLREAIACQEATIGSDDPDLANTFNNLAVVCERLEKVADAEDGYRRAHAIAVASLPPGHPVIATSLKNLVDFCVAHGIPLWRPPAPAVDVPATSPGAVPGDAGPPDDRSVQPSVHGRLTRLVPAVAALVAVFVAAFLLAGWWHESDDPADPPLERSRLPPLPESPGAPASTPGAIPEPVAPDVPREAGPPDASPAAGGDAPPAPASEITVATARLCSTFERRGSPDWQCTPLDGAGQPGTFTYYTRLRTGADTTVEHRWYRDDALYQTVRLGVGANPSGGFRTYSRSTISRERAGAWRVELRAADDRLLHEEHFVVR